MSRKESEVFSVHSLNKSLAPQSATRNQITQVIQDELSVYQPTLDTTELECVEEATF